VSQEIFILQAQTITFPQQGPYTFGQAPVTLGATASSGLPVTYTVTSGPCTVSGGTLTLTGAGSCVVAADQAGDRTSYGAAPRVSSTIVVAKATPTIGWADPAPITYGTALSAGQLDATASVPGSFAYAPGAGAILNAGANQPLTATFTPTDTGNYTTATATAHITVNPAPTATTLTATPNPSLPGQAVTFTATVSPGDGGGTFGFKADGTTIAGCGAQAVSAASPYRATCTTGALGAGAHAITATYSGDANYQANTSSALAQQVGKASTQTTLASSANPSVYGQTVTFTATVSPGDGGGTVAFSSDGTTIPTCSAQAVSSTAPFKATCTTTGLSVGTHAITAVYSGDANYQGSSSAAFSQAVNKAPTKLAAAAAKRGLLTTTFAATLTRRLDGAPLAGQPVVFLVQGVRACQATTNSAGVAVCTTVGLFLGPTTYTATYAGDANYQPSTATATL
jgi:hypothetical protein